MRRGPMPLTSLRNDGLSSMTQGALAEDLDDLAGEVRADALDQAGAEVFLDALDGVRRRAAQLVGLELLAVVAVLHPVAGRLDVLAGDGAGQVADDGDEAAPAARPGRAARRSPFGVVKGDALDDAGQVLGHDDYCTANLPQNGCRPAGVAAADIYRQRRIFLPGCQNPNYRSLEAT